MLWNNLHVFLRCPYRTWQRRFTESSHTASVIFPLSIMFPRTRTNIAVTFQMPVPRPEVWTHPLKYHYKSIIGSIRGLGDAPPLNFELCFCYFALPQLVAREPWVWMDVHQIRRFRAGAKSLLKALICFVWSASQVRVWNEKIVFKLISVISI